MPVFTFRTLIWTPGMSDCAESVTMPVTVASCAKRQGVIAAKKQPASKETLSDPAMVILAGCYHKTVAHALVRAVSRLVSTPALDHGYSVAVFTKPAFTGLFSI